MAKRCISAKPAPDKTAKSMYVNDRYRQRDDTLASFENMPFA